MRYGFSAECGFVVLDDDNRISEYAYPTSNYWLEALKDAHGTALTMLARTWHQCPDFIRERHYVLCQQLLPLSEYATCGAVLAAYIDPSGSLRGADLLRVRE